MRRIITTIILILICASLGFVGIKYAGEKENNPINNGSSIELSSSSEISNENSSLINNSSNREDESSNEIKDVVYDFDKITKENNTNHITLDYDLIEKVTESKYTINLMYKNIKLNNNSYTVMIKNYSPNDFDCQKGKDKVLYINNRILKEANGEECYIAGLSEIIVLNSQYLILLYGIQNGGEVFIFDQYGKEIEFTENIYIVHVVEVENEHIIYRGKGKNDVGCVSNKYKMEIKNGKIINTLLEEKIEEDCL